MTTSPARVAEVLIQPKVPELVSIQLKSPRVDASDVKFKKETHETIGGNISKGEALATMIGHMTTAGVIRDMDAVRETVNLMLKDNKIPQETKIKLVGQLKIFDSLIVDIENTETSLDSSMSLEARLALEQDIDINVLKRNLKVSEKKMSLEKRDKLQKEITAKENIRKELKNKDGSEIKDQVEEFAILLASGDKTKVQEDPIGYIGKFFTEELPKAMQSEKTQKDLADKMGLTPEQMKTVNERFTEIQVYQEEFDILNKTTSDYREEQTPKGQLKKLGKKGLMLSGIFSVLGAFLAYKALNNKEER